jgi:hypothetical protein
MKKIIIILGIFMISTMSISAFAVTQVYDSERDVFYMGGYVLDNGYCQLFCVNSIKGQIRPHLSYTIISPAQLHL